MHAAEDDDIALGLLSLAGQGQGITHKVGQVLDFRALVAVSQDNGVALLLQTQNFVDEIFVRHNRAGKILISFRGSCTS